MAARSMAILGRASAIVLSGMLALSMFGCTGIGATSRQGNEDANATDPSTEPDLTFSKRDLDPSYDTASATRIALEGTSATIEGEGASVEGSTVTLDAATTYIVSGELTDGRLLVNAGDEDKLQIVLDGATIHNETGPAIMIENADKCFITLADGTTNTISDGSAYELAEDDNSDATIFSRDDLTINGSGSLSVEGNYQHAIVSKDDLVITGGTIGVRAAQDAFQGKDALKIANGTFTVEAGDDAFHSEYLFYVKDGSIDITTCYEGYEAEKVIIDGGEHSIYATDDAINAAAPDEEADDEANTQDDTVEQNAAQNDPGMQPPNDGNGGERQGSMPFDGQALNGQSAEQFDGQSMPAPPEGAIEQDGSTNGRAFPNGAQGETDMRPDLPSGDIEGAEGFAPDSVDNAFKTGRKGLGGADGNDAFDPSAAQDQKDGNFRGGHGAGMATTSEECLIQINGGTFDIVGESDAIDSNGNVELNGGTLLVCGPSMGMDGALDYDLSAQITGGTILMLGSVGSTRGLDESVQAWSVETLRGEKGATVSVLDGTGNVVVSMEASMAFESILVSAPSISNGQSYTIRIGDADTSFTM